MIEKKNEGINMESLNKDTQTGVLDKPKCKVGIWTKVWAVTAQVICSLLIAGCFFGALYMIDNGYYYKSFYQILNEAFAEFVPDEARFFMNNYISGNTAASDYHCEEGNISFANLYKKYSAGECWEYGDSSVIDDSIYVFNYTEQISGTTYTCNIVLGYDLKRDDNFRNISLLQNFIYTMRYAVYIIALLSFVSWIFLYVFLLKNAGYTKGSDKPKQIFESYIPFEINLGFMIGAALLSLYVIGEIFSLNIDVILVSIAIIVALEIAFIIWSICLAIRIKTGYIWKTMILRYIIIGTIKLFKLIGRGLKALIKIMPFIWQAVLGLAALAVLFLVSAALIGHYGILTTTDLVGWIMFLVLIVCVLVFGVWIAIGYRKLERKTSRLANGDISGDVDTRFMLPLFVKQAEDLKIISGGIVISNEKRLASERTQTALITNVSHDIKTPLTSIINYSDLISKENCDNEKITEYAEVLGRQSTRLKRLLEDLIEVSKAQSGALEVNLQVCEAATLVNQAAGEFEERLNSCSLELVTKGTDSDIKIMADPRRMWRVFDNLLGNICKYAQPGTRVYMNIEEHNGKCAIIFKNTSAKELDMSPEELMARFVRGDKSREGAEGNGLGLSIASNLVQLQKGTMEISIDGDLFKVTMEFPVVS